MNYVVNVSTQLRNSPKYFPETQLILTHSSLLLYMQITIFPVW